MNMNTLVTCPDLIRGGANPWQGTLVDLINYNPDRLGDVIADLESRGLIEVLPEGADEWRWSMDIVYSLTLDDVRRLADDPNATVGLQLDDRVIFRSGGSGLPEPGVVAEVVGPTEVSTHGGEFVVLLDDDQGVIQTDQTELTYDGKCAVCADVAESKGEEA